MRLPLPNLPAVRARRRATAILMVVAYLLTLAGLPTQSSSARDLRPFPCQAHRCACQSADACWSHCCCFTQSQRLAWARANDVDPPADEVAGHDAASDSEHDHPAAACCHTPDRNHERPTTACGHKSKGASSPGVRAAKCHGVSTLWVTSGAVVPLELTPSWAFDWVVVGRVSATYLDLLTVVLDPAVPPPRSLATLGHN